MAQKEYDPTELASVVFGPLHYGIKNQSKEIA